MVFGQKAQFKKADKAYKAQNYAEAIPLYEEGLAIKDNLSRKTKLANSYRMINQLDKAASIFREIVKDPKAKPITYYYLGESLMSAGNYDEAKYWFQQYHLKEPEDQKALLKIAACNQVKDINPIYPDMGVIPFAHNSDMDDNSPIYWNNQILFSSDRNQGIKLLKQKSGVTGRDYIQIYSSSEGNDFNYDNPKSYSKKVNELNKNNSNITISQDGTRAVFSRNSKNANKKNTHTIQLFEMESTDGNKWKNIKEVDFANNAYNFMHPALSPDGNTLFFVSDKGSGHGGTDIYVSYYKKNKWSRPVNLGPVINTDANEGFPFFDKDGKLFFCSKGHAGYGGFDIFFSTQNAETEQWDAPINVGSPVNSPADDISIFIDHESRRGLFTSSRDGGDDDIFLCWLDGLPNGLEETEIPTNESEPVIAETTIESETIKEEVTADPTLAETAIEQPEVATEIVEATDVPVEEVVIDAVEEINVEATGKVIPSTDPIPSTEEIIGVPSSEIVEEIEIEAPSTPEVTTPKSTVVNEVVDKVEKTEIKTLPIPKVTTPESAVVNEVVEKVEEIELETPSPPAGITPEPAATKDIIEKIEETNISLPDAQPIKVSNIEEIVETTIDTVSLSEKNKVTETELIKEITKEEVIPGIPPQTETPNKESIPTTEMPEKVLEKTEIPAPNVNTTSPDSAPTAPGTKDNIKGRSISSAPTRHASFSTLKKDIRKKRPTAGKIYRLKNISYDPGGYLVAKAHGDALDEVYKILKQNQAINIEIASHTYSIGNDQTNLKLSQNRARRAAKYLIDKGISTDRVFPVGYGEEQILNRCTNGVACTQVEHAKNERLEIQIIDESH